MFTKKRTVALLFCLLLAIPALAQRKTDKEIEGLSGKVRTVSNTTQVIRKPANDDSFYFGFITTYDSSGTMTQRIRSHPDSTGRVVGSESTFNRDALGNRVETVRYGLVGPNGELQAHQKGGVQQFYAETFKYDAAGNRAEISYYAGNGPDKRFLRRETFTHDREGNVLEWRFYGPNDDLKSKYVFTYDATGNLKERAHHDSKGWLMDRSTYTNYKFDSQRNWIDRTWSNEYFTRAGGTVLTIVIEKRTLTYY